MSSESKPTVEVYEGELEMIAHQAMEVIAKKTGLKYNIGCSNSLYLSNIADALLTKLKHDNPEHDIVVIRKA